MLLHPSNPTNTNQHIYWDNHSSRQGRLVLPCPTIALLIDLGCRKSWRCCSRRALGRWPAAQNAVTQLRHQVWWPGGRHAAQAGPASWPQLLPRCVPDCCGLGLQLFLWEVCCGIVLEAQQAAWCSPGACLAWGAQGEEGRGQSKGAACVCSSVRHASAPSVSSAVCCCRARRPSASSAAADSIALTGNGSAVPHDHCHSSQPTLTQAHIQTQCVHTYIHQTSTLPLAAAGRAPLAISQPRVPVCVAAGCCRPSSCCGACCCVDQP